MTIILDKGYRLAGPVVNLATAGVANAAAVYQVSNFPQQQGTKSFKPRKLRVRNNAAGNTFLNIGTGAGGTFAAQIPAVMTFNSLDGAWVEIELPEREFFADMTAWPTALVAGGSIDVQFEIEEIG